MCMCGEKILCVPKDVKGIYANEKCGVCVLQRVQSTN
jgi:hypothetical protein